MLFHFCLFIISTVQTMKYFTLYVMNIKYLKVNFLWLRKTNSTVFFSLFLDALDPWENSSINCLTVWVSSFINANTVFFWLRTVVLFKLLHIQCNFLIRLVYVETSLCDDSLSHISSFSFSPNARKLSLSSCKLQNKCLNRGASMHRQKICRI